MSERGSGGVELGTLEADDAVAVYGAVFTLPPWDEGPDDVAAFRVRFAEHRAAADWTGWLATVDGEPAGMVYGCRTPDPFPADREYARVAAVVGEDRLAGAFEVQELAVLPDRQRRGTGRALMTSVLRARPRLWLLTHEEAVAAMRLYAAVGLDELGRDDDLVVWGRGV